MNKKGREKPDTNVKKQKDQKVDNIKKKATKKKAKKGSVVWRKIKSFGRLVWLPVLLAAVIFGLIYAGAWADRYLTEHFTYGVKITGVDVSLKNKEEAISALAGEYEAFYLKKFTIRQDDQSYYFTPEQLGVKVMLSKTIDQAKDYVSSGNFLERQIQRLYLWRNPIDLDLVVEIDEGKLENSLDRDIPALQQSSFNKVISFDKNLQIKVAGEGTYFTFEKDTLKTRLAYLAERFSVGTADLYLQEEKTDITPENIALLQARTGFYFNHPLVLQYRESGRLWRREGNYILDFKKNPELLYFFVDEKGHVNMKMSDAAVANYLEKGAAAEINMPKEDVLIKKDDKGIVVFEGRAKIGEELDIPATVNLIREGLLIPEAVAIRLLVKKTRPTVKTENLGDLKVDDLIGVGISDFTYSSYNRINNISVGLARFNGVVIKQGEEFDYGKVLGQVSSGAGYRMELVIKEGKVVPELGGGLCQVSTTMYRAALSAGLPITQRINHSYYVFHYDPPGTDATVYPPRKNLKFVNDTPGDILVQAFTDGKLAYYNFYGISDGRQVEFAGPEKFNYRGRQPRAVASTNYIPLWDINKECCAFTGVDVIWRRTITWPSGDKKEEEIFSRYMPWPANASL